MKQLEYPYDSDFILRKKKAIRRELLAREGIQYIDKKIAILGGSTTSDIKQILELFLLNYGIRPEFYESEYNQYYQEYLKDPEKEKNKVSKPKQIGSMVLCGVSTAWVVLSCCFWGILYAEGVEADKAVNMGFVMFFLSCFMLIPAIIAKCINRKSQWAVICIICVCIVIAAVIAMSILMPPWY